MRMRQRKSGIGGGANLEQDLAGAKGDFVVDGDTAGVNVVSVLEVPEPEDCNDSNKGQRHWGNACQLHVCKK